MSAKRSTTVYGSVVAAALVTLLVSQCADRSSPAAFGPTDVTVIEARPRPSTTQPAVADPPPQPSTALTTTTPTSSTSTTGLAVTTTTVLIDAAAAGPAEAGVAAPVRGEQFQLTEPIPAPATTTTEPPPPPTSAPPGPPGQRPAPPTTAPPNPSQPPPPPTTQPSTPPPASTSNDAIALTNQERANAGLAPLNANGALNIAAAVHSADQAARNQMTHTGSNGSNAGDRIRAAGYQPSTWGENVAAGYGSASGVVAGWMGSSGHRANILNPAFTQIGAHPRRRPTEPGTGRWSSPADAGDSSLHRPTQTDGIGGWGWGTGGSGAGCGSGIGGDGSGTGGSGVGRGSGIGGPGCGYGCGLGSGPGGPGCGYGAGSGVGPGGPG